MNEEVIKQVNKAIRLITNKASYEYARGMVNALYFLESEDKKALAYIKKWRKKLKEVEYLRNVPWMQR